MFYFDTQFPNTVSFLLLSSMWLGSFWLEQNRDFGHYGLMFLSGLRHIAWAVMVGLLWWMLAHHAREADPGADTIWQLYKGPMRLYSMLHIWYGWRQVFKGFHVERESILTGAPTLFCVVSYIWVNY